MVIAKDKNFRSVKLSENSHYLLRRIATEERSNICLVAEKIIKDYADSYLNKANKQD